MNAIVLAVSITPFFLGVPVPSPSPSSSSLVRQQQQLDGGAGLRWRQKICALRARIFDRISGPHTYTHTRHDSKYGGLGRARPRPLDAVPRYMLLLLLCPKSDKTHSPWKPPKNTHTQNGTHRGRKKHKPVVKAFCSLAPCSICVLCMCFLHIKSIRRSLGGEIGAIVRGSFHRVTPPRLYQVSTCVCVCVGRPWLESFTTQKMRAACKRLK